ncbi:MAG TPA: hypothetical protein VGZ02_07370 [Candidatus Baltobacteraceae bacterium]|jgi:hypothetical protein|nr:hypothetical protein [Candidatus Baltobacteraceae bacterium]
MFRHVVTVLTVVAVAACAARPVPVPHNVSFGQLRHMPPPPVGSPGSSPRIVAAWFSGARVRRGRTWSGRIVTSTNVASVEVRSNLFSIDVPRQTFGRFAFDLHVFDVPPIFVRGYRLRLIARNAAGAAVEEDVPFRIQ